MLTTEVWETDRAGELVDLYNSQVHVLPYSHPVSAARISEAAQQPHSGLSDERIIVGFQGGAVEAFAQVGDLASLSCDDGQPSGACGLIRMFVAMPESLRVAQEVLTGAERSLLEAGHSRVHAFNEASYFFYRYTTPFLTDYWPHVWSLLGSNGYVSTQKGHSYHWRNYRIDKPAFEDNSVKLRFDEFEGAGIRPNLTAEATRAGEVISRVLFTSLDHFSRSPEASDVCYIDGFGTADHERRKGIGRYAMLGGLYRLRQLGYRHVVLDADTDNYPAQLMYLSMGFSKLCSTYRLIRASLERLHHPVAGDRERTAGDVDDLGARKVTRC